MESIDLIPDLCITDFVVNIPNLSEEEEAEFDELKAVLYLNLAICAIRLENWTEVCCVLLVSS